MPILLCNGCVFSESFPIRIAGLVRWSPSKAAAREMLVYSVVKSKNMYVTSYSRHPPKIVHRVRYIAPQMGLGPGDHQLPSRMSKNLLLLALLLSLSWRLRLSGMHFCSLLSFGCFVFYLVFIVHFRIVFFLFSLLVTFHTYTYTHIPHHKIGIGLV